MLSPFGSPDDVIFSRVRLSAREPVFQVGGFDCFDVTTLRPSISQGPTEVSRDSDGIDVCCSGIVEVGKLCGVMKQG